MFLWEQIFFRSESQVQRRMSRVIAVGYYSRSNLGDQQYMDTLPMLIGKEHELVCLDSGVIDQFEFRDSDVILLASGDLVVEYFLDTIYRVFSARRNVIIAVCVGIPYPQVLLQHQKIGIISHVFVRTRQDIDLLSQYFPRDKVHYMPDISRYLAISPISAADNCTPEVCALKDQVDRGNRLFGVSLNRHIWHSKRQGNYDRVVRALARLLTNVVEQHRLHIVFTPFNTNWRKAGENDILIHRDVAKIMQHEFGVKSCFVTLIERELAPRDMLAVFSLFHAALPMRFHACLFALYNNIPMLPVYTTRKVANLVRDTEYPYALHLPCDEQDLPTHLPYSQALHALQCVLETRHDSRAAVRSFHTEGRAAETTLRALLLDVRNSPVREECAVVRVTDKIIRACKGANSVEDVSDKIKMISYHLTGSLQSVYNYGLQEKMHSKSYVSEWKWVVEDFLARQQATPSTPSGLFNLAYIDQRDYGCVHRAGWQYVYDNLVRYNNTQHPMLLDLYVDRTFHWDARVLEALGVIPYRKSWLGVVHHTFHEQFSTYNCKTLMQSALFRESLKCCRGLFVLSLALRDEIVQHLASLGVQVPVFALTHPTETDVPKFSLAKFHHNKDKKLVHVGGWLRNVYSFYALDLGADTTVRKAALKGRHMNNYFPPPDIACALHRAFDTAGVPGNQNSIVPSCSVSTNPQEHHNNWNAALEQAVQHQLASVELLPRVDNATYDGLLSENVVFLNLVDASAVNTVIECAVRHTPIILNRLPALEEMLGAQYPLFYDSQNSVDMAIEVRQLITHKAIAAAHHYLKHCVDQDKFRLRTFLREFTQRVQETQA